MATTPIKCAAAAHWQCVVYMTVTVEYCLLPGVLLCHRRNNVELVHHSSYKFITESHGRPEGFRGGCKYFWLLEAPG
jgi:hypothetical protein